ncbi:MAG: DNA polymerase I, partial [Nitrosomonadales bacterium]|nr:DNA polymerase I [Nitrosomonadales bacterium]
MKTNEVSFDKTLPSADGKTLPSLDGKTLPLTNGKTLLLVDGSSFLYRAFHAMPDLRNREGFPTGAIYGVLNMLRKLRHDYPADYSLCVFDAKGNTFRDDWYPEYKAHRPPMPDDLARQVEPLHQAIAASGWNLLMQEGVEADDVIGTLARQAAQDGVRCIVATGDKDLAQLVNEHVTLVNTMNNEKLDVPGVNAKFGVPPERILDYLTLTGDAVDNVPGVEKVGPKTAVKWLTQYGTLDNLMQHADEIGGVVGENLRKALDWLPQACRLLTVKCDVELPQPYSELAPPTPDTEQLRSLYQHFDFKTWLRELSSPQQTPSPLQGEGGGEGRNSPGNDLISDEPTRTDSAHYETILTDAQLDAWLEKLLAAELVCVDTETTGLDVMN